jgi:hypothetical protein
VATPVQDARDLQIATDDEGRVTLAWSGAINGPVEAMTAAPGHRFGEPILVAAGNGTRRTTPSLAAANGRIAVAWGEAAPDLEHVSLHVVTGRAGAPGPQRIVTTRTLSTAIPSAPAIRATIAGDGLATVLYVDPVEPPSRQAPFGGRLVAVDGR